MAFPGLINRSLAKTVAVCSVLIIWAAGMPYAKADNNMPNKSSSSSQSGSGGNAGQQKPKNSSGVAGQGILHEGMESGQVDQKIRVDRNKGTDPSLPPPVRKNEKGVVTEAKFLEDPESHSLMAVMESALYVTTRLWVN